MRRLVDPAAGRGQFLLAGVAAEAEAERRTRLACQILLTEDMPTLIVRVPPAARNWMGR